MQRSRIQYIDLGVLVVVLAAGERGKKLAS